jgi:tetratricopeptide (TPR) repeat protein
MSLIHIGVAFVLICSQQATPDTAQEAGDRAVAVSQPATARPGEHPARQESTARAHDPTDMGIWLVNLARHQGHLVGRSDPRSASLQVIALLEGARQVAPQCAEAHYWLFDLYYRMGRLDAASKALEKYVKLMPSDETARLRLMESELDQRQTAEDRAEYLRAELAAGGLPKIYASELHRRLAEYFYERREIREAAAEAEEALRLNAMNVPARRLAYEIFGETEGALQRVEMALQLISANPSQANLVWDLGEFLDRLSLHRQAQEWYNRAIDLHHRAEARPVPAEFWYKLAVSYTRSGDYTEAKEAADTALKVSPTLHLARLLRANVLEKLADREAAAADLAAVAKAYDAQIDEGATSKPADEAAEIAWFYCYHHPDKDRALKLSKAAMEEADPSVLARLAYGYALRLNGRTEEGIKILEPLAGVDQMAALELAKAHIERGNKAQAISILHKAATIQYSGIAYELIRDLLDKYGETAPQVPPNSKVMAALQKFHRDVFDYYQRPGDFLKFTLRFASNEWPVTGPLDVVFRLENIGPFPITFGEGYMARPLVAVSAAVGGSMGTTYKTYLQVMMNARPVLFPGDAVEKTVAVDVGPLREELTCKVSRAMEIELSAMFDPVYENGELSAGPGTIKTGPIMAVRAGLDVGPAAAGLLERASSPEVAERIEAADTIAALLAEAETNGDESKTSNLPVDALRTALAGLLSDQDWRVRAHALVGAGWSKLDDRTTNAAAQAVRDKESPVVKMLAVRLFAQQHGEKFKPVLDQLSQSDPSRCVRIMSRSFLPQPVGVQVNRSDVRSADVLP